MASGGVVGARPSEGSGRPGTVEGRVRSEGGGVGGWGEPGGAGGADAEAGVVGVGVTRAGRSWNGRPFVYVVAQGDRVRERAYRRPATPPCA